MNIRGAAKPQLNGLALMPAMRLGFRSALAYTLPKTQALAGQL